MIIKKKRKIKTKSQGDRRERVESMKRDDFYFLFLLFAFFSDLWKSDRRFLLEQKAKLDYVTRATRRYQYLSVSSNSKR